MLYGLPLWLHHAQNRVEYELIRLQSHVTMMLGAILAHARRLRRVCPHNPPAAAACRMETMMTMLMPTG